MYKRQFSCTYVFHAFTVSQNSKSGAQTIQHIQKSHQPPWYLCKASSYSSSRQLYYNHPIIKQEEMLLTAVASPHAPADCYDSQPSTNPGFLPLPLVDLPAAASHRRARRQVRCRVPLLFSACCGICSAALCQLCSDMHSLSSAPEDTIGGSGRRSVESAVSRQPPWNTITTWRIMALRRRPL